MARTKQEVAAEFWDAPPAGFGFTLGMAPAGVFLSIPALVLLLVIGAAVR